MKRKRDQEYIGVPEENIDDFSHEKHLSSGESNEQTHAETMKALEDLRESHLRLAADFENFKRHAKRDLEVAKKKGRDELVRELAEVISELESASMVRGSSADKIAEGVVLTLKKLNNILRDFGYDRVPGVGEPMNPEIHDAVAVVPAGKNESGIIVEEMTPGFTREDKLVLPARVVVSRL